VLGSTIALNPVSFDIASPLQANAGTAGASRGAISTPPPTAAQPGTVTLSPSANPTQPPAPASTPGAVTPPGSVSTPGAVAPPPAVPPETAAPAPQSLGALSCSVDRFRDVSSPAAVTQQLNAILAALGASGQ
jgi:hypothetical protein